MFIKRCPWCGEILPSGTHGKYDCSISKKCKFCGKSYSFSARSGVISFMVFWIWVIFSFYMIKYTLISFLFFIPLLVIIMVIENSSPTIKYYMPYDTYEMPKLYVKVKVKFNKIPFKSFLSYFLFLDGDITPICFVDTTGKAYSLMWCVSFVDIHRKWKGEILAEMTFVSEDAPSELLILNNKFIVFYNRKAIGQGQILSKPLS